VKCHRFQVPILTFHGVEEGQPREGAGLLQRRLRLSDLERYLEILARYFRFSTLDGALDMLAGRRPHCPNTIVLTFDDGYRNNATLAWPVLKQYGATATFFLATGHIGKRRPFWVDRLEYALQHPKPACEFVEIAGRKYGLLQRDRESLVRMFPLLKAACMSRGWGNADREVEAVESQASSRLEDVLNDDHWSAIMTPDDILRVQNEGGSFGSHTVSHAMLDAESDEVVWRELTASKAAVEALTGRPCAFVAFPKGRYTGRVLSLVRQAGYAGAVTTTEGLAGSASDMMELPRIGMPNLSLSDVDFLSRATGIATAISRAVSVFMPDRSSPQIGPRGAD
jgi:peptidoglycan/xylan/chitin deacetylase (PgdA/CDA1 family)